MPAEYPNYTALYDFTYTLNAVGNRTQVVDGSGTTTYAYGNLHRLTGVTYPGPQTDTYTYDANGNRLTKNATTYTYDNADQMTAAGGVSYGYDFNGNQTSRASDAFVWDHENRLTSATIAGTGASYAYSGDGVRRSRTIGASTSTYSWDVARSIPMLLQETTGSNTTTYVYGLGMIYWVDGSGNVTYRLTDGLGSTVALCNGSGTVTDSWTYDVFGAVRSHSGTNGTEFTFTGEQNDPNGLEYLRARYYDSATGRFLGRDPLPCGKPYVYAGNNPANRRDPTGLYEICTMDDVWGYICFDSTEVGLPADPPVSCTRQGVCLYANDEIYQTGGPVNVLIGRSTDYVPDVPTPGSGALCCKSRKCTLDQFCLAAAAAGNCRISNYNNPIEVFQYGECLSEVAYNCMKCVCEEWVPCSDPSL